MQHVPVKAAVSDGIGWLVLDRPAALNALDLEMVRRMSDALREWRDDDGVRAVVVTSSSARAFCSGGDIRAVREAGIRRDERAVEEYFASEYALDAAVAGYPKPYVSLIDGYALGGGLGISAHGRFRVVTERARLAMPETAIGFFPDIGAGYFLPRLRGATGTYLGLTGAQLSGAAAVECGLATHYVASGDLSELEKALASDGGHDVAAVLADFATTAPVSELAAHQEAIDRCFGAAGLEEALALLAAEESEWAGRTLEGLRGVSPSSLWLTWELLALGAGSSLDACFARDLRLARRIATTHDFAEGVRAALVDKDRSPAWSPASLADLTPAHRTELTGWIEG